MPARKRGHAELEADEPTSANEPGMLTRLRNTWQMANIMQWIYFFGDEFKVDPDFDIEDFEEECLKPGPSEKLAELGVTLLKNISSHRGLTTEIFDEYTRRQYLVRKPHDNPFGEEEQPNKFAHFDIFTKLKVLHQLTVWTMSNPERFREKVGKTDNDQLNWRIEEYGWDSEDRAYYLLDDSRLYRRTTKPLPALPPTPIKSKAKSKTQVRPRPKGSRTSKRRRINASEEPEEVEKTEETADTQQEEDEADNGFGGDKWECVCVTSGDFENLAQTFRKSRDPNERHMAKRLPDAIEAVKALEEGRARKIAKRERELLTLEKLASAKRSSRIANRQEKEKEEVAAREAEELRRKELAAAQKDAKRQKEMEDARLSRTMTREQRLKEREYKRILKEEDLRKMEEEQEKIDKGEMESKKSARHLKAEMQKAQEALEELKEEDEWIFDCSGCGVYGQNIDDGKHSIACERCNVWQHSACLDLSQEEAEKEDFNFICSDCKVKEQEAKQREEDAKKPKLAPLKFKASNIKKEAAIDAPSPNGIPEMASDDLNKPTKRKSGDLDFTGAAMPPEKKFKSYMPRQPGQHTTGSSVQHNGNSSTQPFTQAHQAGHIVTKAASVDSSRLSGVSPKQNQAQSNGLATGQSEHKASVPQTPGQTQKQHQSTAANMNGGTVSNFSKTPLEKQNVPPMPPPYTTPSSSFMANSPNISFKAAATPSTPAHPSVPQKQPSAAPSPALSTTLQASSPAIMPPTRLDASFSGISPVKNSSPPRPASQGNSFSSASAVQSTPVVPPAQKLVPSPETNSTNGAVLSSFHANNVNDNKAEKNAGSDSVTPSSGLDMQMKQTEGTQ